MVGGDTKQRKVPTTIELGRNSHILNAESVTEIPLRVFFFYFLFIFKTQQIPTKRW
jgi:hypothetical protein